MTGAPPVSNPAMPMEGRMEIVERENEGLSLALEEAHRRLAQQEADLAACRQALQALQISVEQRCRSRDVAERVHDEAALRESEQRFRLIFEQGPLGMALVGPDYRFAQVNARLAQMLGYSEKELVGMPVADITHPDDVSLDTQLAYRLFRGEVPYYTVEKRYIRQSGGILWVSLTVGAIRDERGKTFYGLGMVQDITERKQVEAEREHLLALAESRAAELDSIISAVAAGLIIYGPQGEILRMNQEAERILGYGPQERARPIRERLAAGIFETVDGSPFPVDESPSMRALRGETVSGIAMVVHRPHQKRLWVSATAAPIRAADGRILGAVLTATDVTVLHDLQEQTARLLEAEHRAREQAEAAVRARDEFLSAAAHELKTPITTLHGYAELVARRLEKEGFADPQQIRRGIQVIDRQADRLARLVAQLIDMAALDAGRLELRKQVTDVAALARGAVAWSAAGAERPDITLQAPPTLPALVDPERLERVLANLLDNAIRFSPKGTPIEVTVSAPDPNTVRVTVRDHGPGISLADRPRLFSRFFQAQPGGAFAGLGLGLYLSRRIIELHGGQMTAEFPPDGGSLFVITLPRNLEVTGAHPAH